jgi:hypothetical protein
MSSRSITLLVLLLVAGTTGPAGAQLKPSLAPKTPTPPAKAAPLVKAPPGVKTISDIPATGPEIERAFTAAANQACDLLPADSPMLVHGYAAALTPRDQRENAALKAIPNPSTRRPMFTVGVQVAREDLGRLPTLSASTILDYLKNHYVSVQARVQRDPARQTLYFHHRPIAATGTYAGTKLSTEFSVAVASTVRDLHSLGVYVPPGLPPTPENLRTLVMVHKHLAVEPNPVRPGSDRVEPRYEFIMVRGRPSLAGNQLDMHIFTTSDDRRKLHYLQSGLGARRPEECTLKAEVMFTKFGVGALEPTESAMRRKVINSRYSFDLHQLDAYTKTILKKNGTALENLNNVLDAVIDGKLRPAPQPAATPGAQ